METMTRMIRTARTTRTHTTVGSPIGPLTLVASGGVLCALYLPEQRYGPDPAAFGVPTSEGFEEVGRQLAEYFEGRRTGFTVPIAPVGTEFQRRVWRALTAIPYGRTTTYAALAVELGGPQLVRAVGSANARNPISIIVPCHRVLGSDGSLTGYGGGLERKQFLLDLELAGRAE
jgi:methylated-DNA-[protein]-cysteine S-methyltransferase